VAALILVITAMSLIGAAITARAAGLIGSRTLHGLMAIANAVNLIAAILTGRTGLASYLAGAFALSVWMWWNSGGGDGTKRRLRSLDRKFQGVRRTAPAGGAS
jgi:CHASE2 domain-containing sensor protein